VAEVDAAAVVKVAAAAVVKVAAAADKAEVRKGPEGCRAPRAILLVAVAATLRPAAVEVAVLVPVVAPEVLATVRTKALSVGRPPVTT
jgi:hypothetical protein